MEKNPKYSEVEADQQTIYSSEQLKQTVQISSHTFNIDHGYKLIQLIGKGAQGIVVSAEVQGSRQKLAIKKIERVLEQRRYARRTLRELKLLRLIKHQNVISLDTIMLPNSRQQLKDVYCVGELMQTDLRTLIRAQQNIPLEHIKYYLYQCLCGIKYIHQLGIIHRDLKTQNILVNQKLDIKICDFGLARKVDQKQKANDLTEYVVTRWYRAPELLLQNHQYTTAVDIWSMGLIFAELLTGNQLLQGKHCADQLHLIFKLIGTPSEEEVKQTIADQEYHDYIKKMPHYDAKDFQKVFPTADEQAIDLLRKMLLFDFNKRISAADALEHPFFSGIHIPDERPETIIPISSLEFEFESYPLLTRQQYQDLIYEEILLYHDPSFRKAYLDKIAHGESVSQHILLKVNLNPIEDQAFNDI